MPILVSIIEAARMISVSRTTIFAMIANGTIPACKVGRRTLISVAALHGLADRLSRPSADISDAQ